MSASSSPWTRIAAAIALVLGLLSLPGCGGVKRIPVSGNVTLDAKPLDDGLIVYNPDETKGNTLRAACTGRVKNGRYTLNTSAVDRRDTGDGAPLGWFKITLTTDLPGMQPVKIAPKFQDPNNSPISIEISDNPPPGNYDVAFTSK